MHSGDLEDTLYPIYKSEKVVVKSGTSLILPGKYACLTKDPEFQIRQYDPIDPTAILEVSALLTFQEKEDYIVVYGTDSLAPIDELHYYKEWHFPNLTSTDGVSLERIDFDRPTNSEHNWHSAATVVNYGTPGYRNSEALEPDGKDEVWLQPVTFSPDQDAHDDHLSINYSFPGDGWNIKASIFDNKGRLVRIVQQNSLTGTHDPINKDGALKWDGTNASGQKAAIGIYVVLVEAVKPGTGEVKYFKLGCVLAARLASN